MKQARLFTRILIAAAVLLLCVSCGFAAEEVVTMGPVKNFQGFEQNNMLVVHGTVFWQTDSIKKAAPAPKDVNLKIIRDDSGKFYEEIEGFGRAEVRLLKLIIDETLAEETVSIKMGGSVSVSSGERWKFLDTVRGKKIRKGDKLTIAYDAFDNVHRIFPWDDTWQVAAQKQ